MDRRLLIAVGRAAEGEEARRYLVELIAGLATVGVATQVAVLGPGRPHRDLAAIADVRAWSPLPPRTPFGLARSAARRVDPALAEWIDDLRRGPRRRWLAPPDAVLVGGPEAAPLLGLLGDVAGDLDVPVTTYVHPRDFNLAGLQPADRQRMIDLSQRFLVAEEEAASDLLADGVAESRIELAPDPLIFPRPPDRSARTAARRALGLPSHRIVIGTPPVPDWAMGPDLTLALAWELQQRRPVGGPLTCWYEMPADPERRWPVEHDIERMGLGNVHLAGTLPEGIDPFDLFDLIVLPSRSPQPLPDLFVTWAAARGTPVLCWSGDRLADAVRRWTGGVVDQPDVTAMAGRILALADDPAELARVGRAGRMATMAVVERLVPLGVSVP